MGRLESELETFIISNAGNKNESNRKENLKSLLKCLLENSTDEKRMHDKFKALVSEDEVFWCIPRYISCLVPSKAVEHPMCEQNLVGVYHSLIQDITKRTKSDFKLNIISTQAAYFGSGDEFITEMACAFTMALMIIQLKTSSPFKLSFSRLNIKNIPRLIIPKNANESKTYIAVPIIGRICNIGQFAVIGGHYWILTQMINHLHATLPRESKSVSDVVDQLECDFEFISTDASKSQTSIVKFLIGKVSDSKNEDPMLFECLFVVLKFIFREKPKEQIEQYFTAKNKFVDGIIGHVVAHGKKHQN